MHRFRNLRSILLLAAFLAVALCPAARAQLGSGDLRGRAPQVIDSGLIDLGGRPVYLYGLRGLQRGETCNRSSGSGGQWDCGQEAWWAARNRIASHWVDCVERGRGPGGEIFAVCYLGGVGGPELNSWLVEQGWALAASDYAQDYVGAEAAARAAGRGVWRRH
jgi:endonuclease YncB( thermonuclease family)